MFPVELLPLISILVALYVAVVLFSYLGLRRMKRDVIEQEKVAKHRLYELAILKEIGDRTGYSLNIQKILDVIVGSLNQFLGYSAVSYMLLNPSKIVFKVDLDESVPPQFIKDIRARMLSALSAISGRDLENAEVEETITGAIMLDTSAGAVQSYFNIPLVIADQLVGVLTVANTKPGLYKEAEMEILYKIVNQASQAVTKLEGVVKTEQGKISAMLESMSEGVVMTDRDYRVLAANPEVKKIIGYELDSLPTIFDFIDTLKGTIDVKARLEEAIKLDKVITIKEISFNSRFYQVVISPVRSNMGIADTPKGDILGGVIIFHNITTEKEAEKMRNDFTSMMVHELRSPLGNIKKIGEIMRTTNITEDKKALNEYVSMFYESSSAMLDLVNDLLDVAKLESGKFDIEKHPIDIKRMVESRVKFFDTVARDKEITMKFLAPEDISFEAIVDERRLAQVMNNVLSNAINYTARGGAVTVLCFVHKNGNAIEDEAKAKNLPWVSENMPNTTPAIPNSFVVGVTDTGEGISKEHMERLFNKFTQFISSVRESEHKGTGLGLVILKGIVEAHGGTVGVGSAKDVGSTFYFTIPL